MAVERAAKRRKVAASSDAAQHRTSARASKIFAPFRTIGLVSPTAVPFTAVPLGKTTFQITTSVGRSLQTYDLRRGLNLVFIARPQTPGLITATSAWTDKVLAAWEAAGSVGERSRGVTVFKRGRKVAQLQIPLDMDENIVELMTLGSWIIGCCTTRIEVWNSATYEHHTTLVPPFSNGYRESSILTGGICHIPTYTNKICAGREDGSVEIWNVSTGKLLYTIHPPSTNLGPVTALQPTPAVSLVAIAYMSGRVTVHDILLDKEILRLNAGSGDQSPITCISFRTDSLGAGDDGRKAGVMATASYNSGDVTLWDLNEGGRRMGTLRGAHAAPSKVRNGADGGISKVAFLPGQSILVSTGLDNSLKSWIFDETPFSPIPRILHSRSGHAAPVTTLNFLPADADGADAGGKWLLSTSKDRSFWGWSLRRDGQSSELSQGNVKKKAKKMGLLSNGISTSSEDGDGVNGLKAPEITCLDCCLNRDGGMGALPGSKILWASAKQLKGRSTATEQNITGWESVVTGHTGEKSARTWFWGRRRAGRWLLETGDGTEVKSVAISPCGTFAVVGSRGGSVDMYNLQSGLHRQRYPPRPTPAQVKKLQQQKDQQLELNDFPVNGKSWGRGEGRHTKAVTGIAVDNMNRKVITCGLDGRIKFWDFVSGLLLQEIDWQGLTSIDRLVFHRANNLLALSCDDLSIRIVDVETAKVVRELVGCKGSINDLCFSNDGRWVIAASSDSVIRVWDLPTGHLIDAVGLRAECTAIAFSNTGEFLAAALVDSVGVDVWTNRTLFTHVPTRQISEDEIASVEAPTASGEGGSSLLSGAFEDAQDETQQSNGENASLPAMEQLSEDVTTLSLVPKSRWQTLLHLELIRARNKPVEPPKPPEKAPFFLPALDSTAPVASTDPQQPHPLIEPTERIRVSRITSATASPSSTTLGPQLRNPFPTEFISHMKSLAPSAADTAIRTLHTTEMAPFVDALTDRLRARRDYELVQAWMAVFLRCHGAVVQEDVDEADGLGLAEAVRGWREAQRVEAERLGRLVGFCSGVVGFLRSAR